MDLSQENHKNTIMESRPRHCKRKPIWGRGHPGFTTWPGPGRTMYTNGDDDSQRRYTPRVIILGRGLVFAIIGSVFNSS